MAVPDPHFDELTLMSYEPRHRECKDLYKVPRRNDFIEVLWCLDHLPSMPNRWCPAEVLHVSGPPDQEYLARGVIRYLPCDTWGEQFDFVDFLERLRLRCSANDDDDAKERSSDCDDGNNKNPSLEWRLRSEPVAHSDTESIDDNWCGESSQRVGSQQGKTLIRVASNGVIRNHNEVEIKSLRNGHSSLVVEVEKLKREVIKLSRHLQSLENTKPRHMKCTSAGCVLPRIRQTLALKMQASLKQAPTAAKKRKRGDPDQDLSICYVDGVLPGVVRARVECTLQQFESLSRQIPASSCSSMVFFFPDFSFTQLPLLGSSEFRVLFKTFSNLCDTIGISSASDKKEMARKCGKGSQGELLRLLGTYCYDHKDQNRPVHFFPGTSCGHHPPQKFADIRSDVESTHATNDKQDPLFPLLTRRTREWNKVDGRFKHGLRRACVPLTTLTDSCSDMNAFALVWRRAAELGGKVWSRALSDSGEEFGWLEVCIPFLQTQGKKLCQELGGLGNDDMWDELLSEHT